MIRFSCPHCHRDFVLADALAHLPLLCKGCGHQVTAPGPSLEPELPLEFFAPPPPAPPMSQKPARLLPVAPPPDDADDADDLPLFDKDTPDIDFNAPPPKELRRSAFLPPPVPPPPAPPPKPHGGRKLVAFAADVMVALLLAAGGVFLGELLANKGTREVVAGINGPKFPQVELLMWLAPPVLLVLVYLLLGSRGKTVGGWLRKRAG